MLNIFAEALYLATRLGTTGPRSNPLAEFHEDDAKALSSQPRTPKR